MTNTRAGAAFCRQRLDTRSALTTLTREEHLTAIARLRADPALPPAHTPLLDALESWNHALT